MNNAHNSNNSNNGALCVNVLFEQRVIILANLFEGLIREIVNKVEDATFPWAPEYFTRGIER